MVDLQRIEQEWTARGFSFAIWTDPAGQRWENYVHDVDELFMVIEGDVELEMHGEKLHPQAGEEILIPAHSTHSMRTGPDRGSRWLYGYKTS